MKPARAHGDVKPEHRELDGVTVVRRERPPGRQGRRLLELLVDLLDKPDHSGGLENDG